MVRAQLISPILRSEERKARREQLRRSSASIVDNTGEKLPDSVQDTLLDQLTDATVHASPGLDLRGAVALNRASLELMATAINDPTDGPADSRIALTSEGVQQAIATAPLRRLQTQVKGPGRPADVWKRALMGDVQSALGDADVRGNYWKTGTETVLTQVFRECARASGQKITGDLRGIFRGRFKLAASWPLHLTRYYVRRLAKAIWEFLPPDS